MHHVTVVATQPSFNAFRLPLERVVTRACTAVKKRPSSCTLYLVDDATIAELNSRFRGKEGPTTVLSFTASPAFPFPDSAGEYLGEIYLAPHCIAARGESIFELSIHGLLHLVGYTHASANARMRMERQEKILQRICMPVEYTQKRSRS